MGTGGISIWQMLVLLFIFVIGVLPWLMALISSKVTGYKKAIWFGLSFLFSWLGYVFYYLVVVRNQVGK